MFKCSVCDKIFKRSDYLARHLKTHNGNRYPCSDCESLFTYKTNLTRHIKNKHGACIDITPSPVTVPISAGPSNSLEAFEDVDDATMVECLDVIEELGLLNNEGKILFRKNYISFFS